MAIKPDPLVKAEEVRRQLGCPFIAITGSNGKTTTRSMLSQILQRAGRVCEFTLNSGRAEEIAAELLRLDPTYDWAVIKLSAAIPGEIDKAAELIQPHMAIVTNIGEAHLNQYGTIDRIATAKAGLLHFLPQGGTALLNRDNEYTRLMGENLTCRVAYFGLSPVSDYYADDIRHLGPGGTSFTVYRRGRREATITMAIYSLGDVYNALAAWAAATELGVESALIQAALEDHFLLPEGRGRMHSCCGIHLIDDSYDATPQSFYKSTKTLLNFREYARRLLFVMGDISDPREQPEHTHIMMGHYIAGMPIDVTVLVGPHAATTAAAISTTASANRQVICCTNLTMALGWLSDHLQPGDAVLVEGGDSVDMAALVHELIQGHLLQGPSGLTHENSSTRNTN
ncbi:MAG TPA: UDP-N-acetylmuramoyl-tripeptide--D-alanyl-D-alanine ligase [bacterium]|nr:UDP-N-acetylmuramoyl-tripeptide--D-alanyl-D-alanine ligase [bacterium]